MSESPVCEVLCQKKKNINKKLFTVDNISQSLKVSSLRENEINKYSPSIKKEKLPNNDLL